MSPRPMPDATAIARRQSPTPTASTTISGPVIVGIAIAGAVVLCGILTAVGLYFARTVHQHKKAESREVEAPQDVGKDIRTVLEMTQPEAWPGRQSLGRASLQGSSKRRVASTWPKEDSRGGPTTPRLGKILKRRSLSPEKPTFRISGIRDSWPLVSHMDMPPYTGLPLGGLVDMPASNNPAATTPNGYPPKWPPRTCSRASRQNLVFDTPTTSPESQPFSRIVETRDIRADRRHSTSERQLTSILRSTSQRLKRNSLTRARSSIGAFPGSPPKERLPSPPRPTEKSTEGREKTMTPVPSSYDGSVDSSIYERYINRTPSPGRKVPRTAGKPPPKRARSPALSVASEDSLCGGKDTPDLVVPATLTSPSKRGTRNEQRHKVRISSGRVCSGGSSEISTLLHKDARSSVSALGNRNSMVLGNRDSFLLTGRNSLTPRGNPSIRISLQGDPFRSSVQSSTPPTVGPNPLSRPLYIRKSTFGGQATPERPSSYVSTSSPLRDVSGNEQTPPNKSKIAPSPLLPQVETQSNPFQWAPQEAKAHQIIKTSGSRRKAVGQKRSNTRRVSVLPKHRSVDMLLETPEEDSPGTAALKPKLLLPRGEKFIATELADVEVRSAPPSPSRSPNREIGLFRPPSIPDFNPSLKMSRPALDEAQESSIDPGGALYLAPGYSSTLAMCNYYDDGSNSEDEFFKNASLIEATSRRRRRDFVGKEEEKSENRPPFPRPRFSVSKIPKLIPPSPPHSPVRPPSVNISPPTSPTPFLLSTPQNSHLHGLHGPRKEPPKTGITMETQICMLRRMNSDVSAISSIAEASPRSETLETPPAPRGRSIIRTPSPSKRAGKERPSRASKHYLNLGSGLPSGISPSKRRPGMSIRDSMLRSRVSEKVEEETEKAEEARNEMQDDDKYETVYDPTDFFSGGELTPIRVLKKKRPEATSPSEGAKSTTTPPKGLNIHSLRYPILSPAGQSTVIDSSRLLLPDHDRATRTRVRIQNVDHPNRLNQTPASNSNSGLRRSPIRRQKTPATDGKRWSDAMVKAPLSGVRNQRESKMEMPKPRTPPKWKNLGISQEDVSQNHEGFLGQENGRMSPEKEAAPPSRPESLGLYDEEGFLRTSPERLRLYDHMRFLRSSPETIGMI